MALSPAGFLLMAVLVPALAVAEEGQILMFDPDANYSNLQELTTYFQRYLDGNSPGWSFQAVRQRAVFEDLTRQGGKRFAIVSSEYLRSAEPGHLTCLLVQAVQGDIYYHKLLVDNGHGDQKTLSDKTIAATAIDGSNSPQAKALLAELANQGAAGATLVAVPKDLDALMALYFGQVDAAIVTRRSIGVLQRVNPQAAAALRTLYEFGGLLRSAFCAVGREMATAQQETMAHLFKRMGEDTNGREVMHRMAFDAWVPFAPDMLKK